MSSEQLQQDLKFPTNAEAQISGNQTMRTLDKETFDSLFVRYRTPDGSCNNLKKPIWGQANTALQRVLFPVYDDGVSRPRGKFGARMTDTRYDDQYQKTHVKKVFKEEEEQFVKPSQI